MKYITVVIEYEDDAENVGFSGNMELLGGKVIACQFNDALEELRKLEDESEK